MALPTHAAFHRRLPMRLAHGIHLLRVAPEWLRVLRLRPMLISGVAITLGPVHGIADARVVPRHSGPKRLDICIPLHFENLRESIGANQMHCLKKHRTPHGPNLNFCQYIYLI